MKPPCFDTCLPGVWRAPLSSPRPPAPSFGDAVNSVPEYVSVADAEAINGLIGGTMKLPLGTRVKLGVLLSALTVSVATLTEDGSVDLETVKKLLADAVAGLASSDEVSQAVTAEQTRATNAETANASAIEAETTRATNAESTLTKSFGSKLDKSSVGTANGVAGLDENGRVPSSQLPSYVDDVLEFGGKSAFPEAGETGKIYVALDTNLTYRWSGTAYVEISPSLALGETNSTAYAGDKGKDLKDAFDTHVDTAKTVNPHKVTAAQVGVTLADGTLTVGEQSITPLTNKATGTDAFAFGDNDASASYGSALGSENTASGTYSVAVGRKNEARGQSSAAVGVNAEATAPASSAFGVSAKAYAANSTVVGYHAYAGTDEKWKGSLAFSQTLDKIYIGSSTEDSGATAKTLKDCLNSAETDPVFTEWRDENILTAAGYEASASNGSVKNTSSVAVGAYNAAEGANTSAVGCGGNKAIGARSSAFGCDNDAGPVAGGEVVYTGGASAFGHGNTADRTEASAFGHGNEASGDYSSAFGHGNIVSGTDASAFGCDNIGVTGERASGFGYANDAEGESASAFGHGNSADAKESSAFGCGNHVKDTRVDGDEGVTIYVNQGSSAFGYGNSVEGEKATAIGCENEVTAPHATAVGYKAYARWGDALAVSQTPANIYLGAKVTDKGASERTLQSYLDEKASVEDLKKLSALVGEANERLEAVA